jgi:hypothetical protein
MCETLVGRVAMTAGGAAEWSCRMGPAILTAVVPLVIVRARRQRSDTDPSLASTLAVGNCCAAMFRRMTVRCWWER